MSQPQQDALCGVCRRPLSLHIGFANRPCSEIPVEPQQDAPIDYGKWKLMYVSFESGMFSRFDALRVLEELVKAEAALTQANQKIEEMGEQIAELLNINYKLEHKPKESEHEP